MTRDELITYVRGQRGTAFRHQGRVPGVGLDCAGLIVVALWDFGVWPRTRDVVGYPAIPDGRTLQALCEQHMAAEITQEDMRAGDALLVRWDKGPPQHLGVLFDYPKVPGKLAMVHADSVRAKAITETRVEFGRAMGFVAAYRIPGIED